MADAAIRRRRAGIRRARAACIAKLDRTETLYSRDRLNEVTALSRELVQDFVRLMCVLHGISDEQSSAALEEPGHTLSLLPKGDLRDAVAGLLTEWRAMQVANSEGERHSTIRAFVTAAVGVLQRARRVFREKQLNELRTPFDVYKRRLGLAVVTSTASVAIATGAVYAIYQLRLPRITIVEATFGGNCDGIAGPPGAPRLSIARGNVTPTVAATCNDSHPDCEIAITPGRYGEPAPMCGKEFSVTWLCSGDPSTHHATIASEATGKHLSLTCENAPRIEIREATYGANCDGKPAPGGGTYPAAKGNQTAQIARRCNFAERSCSITVGLDQMADPAPLCGKEFEVVWSCSGDGKPRKSRIAPEALGQTVVLSCL